MAETVTTDKPTSAPAAAADPRGGAPMPNASVPKPATQQAPDTQTAKFPLGIAGEKLETVERQFPGNEPPPLAPNEQLNAIGKPTPRVDGRAKVTGAAKYTADVKLPGMLYAKMLVSPNPHAKIKSIDTSAAEKAPGVRAVHILEQDLSAARTSDEKEAQEKYPRIRYAGQPIGAVAAESQALADEAVRLIKIEFEPLPMVVSVDKAKQPNAPVIFMKPVEQGATAGGGGGPRGVPQKGNVRGPAKGGRGADQKPEDQAFADADAVVEADYHTQVQTHSALETHGVVSDWKPDGCTVYASTQGTGSVRDEIAAVFNLKKSQVRVITEFMGGGFGAKFGAGNFGVLATHLSKKAGAPVRLMLDRKQEHLCVGNRPSSNQAVKIGAKKDGSLVAIKVINFGTAGVGTGAGATGPAQNLYPCPWIYTEDYDVFTNAGPSAAFRAPGHPQGAFSFEQAIDELAHKLDIDPVALRDKIDESEARRVERRIGAEMIGWKNRKAPGTDSGPVKRGIGMAQAVWYRMASPRDSHCEVRIIKDGSVEMLSAVQDIGGGIRTAMAMCVAEELGLKPSDITTKIGDTSYPQGANSGGSVTTNSMTPVARTAAWQARQQFLSAVASALGAKSSDDLDLKDGRVILKSDPSKSVSFRAACGKLPGEQIAVRADRPEDYDGGRRGGGGGGRRGAGGGGLGGVQFAQVAVDTETGYVKVERIVAVHDCGRPINPLTLQSQINGGVLQGISYALYENRILDKNEGLMVNANMEQYKIIGSRETPQIDVHVIEQYWGKSATDAAGIGEPAIVATAAAVANAVYNATGVRVRSIPMTPSTVLEAMENKRRETARI